MAHGASGTTRPKEQTAAAAARRREGEARRAGKERYRRYKEDTRPPMKIGDTAEYLGVSRWTVRRLIDDGRLRAVMVGDRQRVLPIDADEYLGVAS